MRIFRNHADDCRRSARDLPDNEDDLVAYLVQLAGMSGAAGSRQTFFIDGFIAPLPPKDQIQQIIIDKTFLGGNHCGTR